MPSVLAEDSTTAVSPSSANHQLRSRLVTWWPILVSTAISLIANHLILPPHGRSAAWLWGVVFLLAAVRLPFRAAVLCWIGILALQTLAPRLPSWPFQGA